MESEYAFLPLFAVVLSLGVTGLLVVPSWSMVFAALAALSCLGIGVVVYATYWC
ncbi:hypothetical protein EGH21_13040 [Halomicroarcula sp. F13]|uniref:Uncharacterized protein n=1 Tax=Haloarcula rubra TaxID=2487747 RepID=A0AAW4PS46_9EURY|nr:hypothetical protein [Halomicroarcula rubra]MBX0323957.1 hypothetical protein [Halomicroarcula rubra]